MSIKWLPGHVPPIPEISDDELRARMKVLSPIVADNRGDFHAIKPVNPRNIAFTWSPVLDTPVQVREIGKITTFHRCGYVMMFKPSIAEVLAQTPPEYLTNGAKYFCTENDGSAFSEGDGHAATTTFYAEANATMEPEGFPPQSIHGFYRTELRVLRSTLGDDEKFLNQVAQIIENLSRELQEVKFALGISQDTVRRYENGDLP